MAGAKNEIIAKKLKAAGKWTEFCERKLGLKNGGLTVGEAYRQAVAEFEQYLTFDSSPSSGGDGKPKLPSFVCLNQKDFADKNAIPDKEAINWAIENCGFKDVEPKDAPSSTAWMYVVQFRGNGDFFRDVLKKRVPNISKIEQEGGHVDDGRKQFRLIDKLRAEQAG